MGVSMCVRVCVRQVENGFVTEKRLKSLQLCLAVNEAKMYERMQDGQLGKEYVNFEK